VVGKLVQEVLPAASLASVFAKYEQAISMGRPVSWEDAAEFPSGTRYGEITVAPLFDQQGRCTNLVGTVHDVTVRKRAELEHRQLQLQLQQAQRMQALGTLAGGIAHDFNNILTAISGHAQLALHDLPSEHPVQESLTEIRKASRRATDLVRQILTLGRRDEPRREALQLRPVVEEAVRLLRGTLPTLVELRVQLGANTPNVSADQTQLHQVLMNLVTNAAHAIGGRAGYVEISSESFVMDTATAATLPELADGHYARIRVRDNGAGMDKATLERAFEPFFTTKAPGHGSGLGLSVVHGIMTSHGGAVTVHSQLGEGTTFELYFPATQAAACDVRSERPASVLAHGEHVLYVDDEEALVFLAARMLKRMGYRVSAYSNSAQALQEFRAHADEFDAMVTDISMPGLSGIELVREVLQVRPDLPVVITSGYIRPEDTASAQRLGVKDVIPKPNTVEDFAEVLSRVISERRAPPPA
jgi:signal transduction histidine kinase/ActR/RegA family two-component response regulator